MLRDTVILSEDRLHEVVEHCLKHDAFAFDVETMGGEHRGVPTKNEVVWIGLATQGLSVAIPMGHPNGDVLLQRATKRLDKGTRKFREIPPIYDEPPTQLLPGTVFQALKPLLFSERTKIGSNVPFDAMSVSKYYGATPPGPYEDTVTLQHLLNENLPQKGLKVLTTKYFGVSYDHEEVGKCIELHPFSKVGHYLYMDCKYTWLLRQLLLPYIHRVDKYKHTLTEVFELEQDLIPVLCAMGLEGAPVDEGELLRLRDELTVMEDDLLGQIYRTAGRKFNMNAPAQKAEVLFSPKKDGGQGLRPRVLTKGGNKLAEAGREDELEYKHFSTAADYLEETYGTNSLVKLFVDHAEVHKLLSTYVIGYLGEEDNKKKPCRIYDGRIHADLVPNGTVTGRFSCREPNLQNIPRPDTELGQKIRGLFKAPTGYQLVVADYGQIEMIILAHFIGHGALFEGIWNGMDPHSATAAALAGIDPVTFMEMVAAADPHAKAARQVAKGVNFAVVYGAGPVKVAAMAGVSVKEAKEFLKIHQHQFPEIYRFKAKVLEVAKSRNPCHIRTIMGRKRRLLALLSRDDGMRAFAERQAVNSLIQGSAADVIKLAMIRLHDTLEPDMKLILSVHDELVTLSPNDKAARCADLVREAMLGPEIANLLTVPLSSDVKVVERWSQGK